jgi:hypothetical protein
MKKYLPLLVLLAGLAAIAAALRPPANPGKFDVVGFSRLPLLVNGRVKPFDTVARTSLLVLQNRQRVGSPTSDFELTPNEWLLDVLFRRDRQSGTADPAQQNRRESGHPVHRLPAASARALWLPPQPLPALRLSGDPASLHRA